MKCASRDYLLVDVWNIYLFTPGDISVIASFFIRYIFRQVWIILNISSISKYIYCGTKSHFIRPFCSQIKLKIIILVYWTMLCRVFVSFSCYIVKLIFLFGHKPELLQMFLSKIIHEGINYSTVCTKVMISLTAYLFITSFLSSIYEDGSLQVK